MRISFLLEHGWKYDGVVMNDEFPIDMTQSFSACSVHLLYNKPGIICYIAGKVSDTHLEILLYRAQIP